MILFNDAFSERVQCLPDPWPLVHLCRSDMVSVVMPDPGCLVHPGTVCLGDLAVTPANLLCARDLIHCPQGYCGSLSDWFPNNNLHNMIPLIYRAREGAFISSPQPCSVSSAQMSGGRCLYSAVALSFSSFYILFLLCKDSFVVIM